MFLGTHVNGLDAKGRISAPADFRAVVRAEGLEGIYCWPSPDAACLVGCGEALMGRYKTMVDGMDLFDPMRDALAHSVFAGVRMLNFDANGRVSLPDHFIVHAGLDDQVAVVGLSDRFEIWSPAAYETHRALQREKLAEQRSARQNGHAAARTAQAGGPA
ncbi:MAG: division/cell wall cluster transcriptional repressor MraZ [Maricaulaceae bacterium]|jgi:MraZ protein